MALDACFKQLTQTSRPHLSPPDTCCDTCGATLTRHGMTSGGRQALHPSDVVSHLLVGRFAGGQQHDAEELFHHLMATLHGPDTKPSSKNQPAAATREEASGEAAGDGASTTAAERHPFGCWMESALTCQHCGRVSSSQRREFYSDITLSLPPDAPLGQQVRLESCLDSFFASETLEGVVCEACSFTPWSSLRLGEVSKAEARSSASDEEDEPVPWPHRLAAGDPTPGDPNQGVPPCMDADSCAHSVAC